MSKRIAPVLVLLLPVLLGSCAAYYSVRETLGYENRDLLVEQVQTAQKEQAAAKEQLGSMLTAFQKLTRDDGEDLRPLFERFKLEVSAADNKAGDVRSRIGALQSLSDAVFKTWQDDIAEMESPELREEGEIARQETQKSYLALVTTMRDATSSMSPVVRRFQDHVVFLEQGVTRENVASLLETSLGVDDDVLDAQDALDTSMAATEAFLGKLAD